MKKLFTIIILGFGLTAFSQDSTNTFDYNYRKGIEHYNKGVDIVNKIQGEPIIENIQTEAKEEFTKALPFLQKAYSINPKNEKVLKGLQGVYFSLYEFDTADKYKKELEALNKK